MTSRQDVHEALKVLAPPETKENGAAASDRDNVKCKVSQKLCFTVVVLGASGDLAKKKTFPALFMLFSRGCVLRVTTHACIRAKQGSKRLSAMHLRLNWKR